jgi:hypothetical protein
MAAANTSRSSRGLARDHPQRADRACRVELVSPALAQPSLGLGGGEPRHAGAEPAKGVVDGERGPGSGDVTGG